MVSPNPRLLAEEEFVSVQPSLIRALDGKVIDALVLQYLYWWWRISTNEHDGYTWVYNSETAWADRLGLSRDQVKRTIMRLEERGLVISCKPNSSGWDHTKWYRIDLEHPLWSEWAESPNRMGEIAHSRLGGIAHSSSSTERTTESPSESLLHQTQESGGGEVEQGEVLGEGELNDEAREPSQGAAPASHPSPITTTEPVPTADDSAATPDSTGRQSPDDDPDPEVVRLCTLLADLYHELGNTRPNPDQKSWYREARLLLTKDGPKGSGWTPKQVEVIMRWALEDPFWKTNIRSMPKLRQQFDTLRMRRNETLTKGTAAQPSRDGMDHIRERERKLQERQPA